MPLSKVRELGIFKMADMIFFFFFFSLFRYDGFFFYTSWMFSLKLWGLIGANKLPIWPILKAILVFPS